MIGQNMLDYIAEEHQVFFTEIIQEDIVGKSQTKAICDCTKDASERCEDKGRSISNFLSLFNYR